MARDKLIEYDQTAANNTVIGDVNTSETMLPSEVNDAFRELASHLKEFADGTEAINALAVDNLKMDGNTISSTDTNGDINLDPNGTGVVALSSTDLTFGDNDKAVFGAGSDLQIYHNGSASVISDVGTGNFFISGDNDVFISKADLSEVKAKFSTNGAVTLYYDSNAKLSTTATGVDVTGTVTMDGATTSGNINFGDNDKAVFGAGNDLQISHEATYSLLNETGTGDFEIRTNGGDIRLTGNSGSDFMVRALSNGAVNLYYDGTEKLATTNTGVDVTGTVAATSFTGDGSSLTGISAGATGGGSDQIFYENGQTVTSNYTITNGKNAMSAGPITINTGVTVTVGTGETWTVV